MSDPAIPLDVFFLDSSLRLHGAEITPTYTADISATETQMRTSKITRIWDVDRAAGAFMVQTESGSIYACRCQSGRVLDAIVTKLETELAA